MNGSPADPRPNGAPPAGDERVRPIPVRAAPRDVEDPRANGSGAVRNEEEGRSTRPSSVRDRAAPPSPTAAPPPMPQPAPPEEPGVRFLAGGREWVARAAGTGFSSRGRGASAPLLLLVFAHVEAPDTPLLEVLAIGRDLGALHEEELVELLARARPFSAAPRRQPLFNEARVGKKGDS